jgi:hypothetical protein
MTDVGSPRDHLLIVIRGMFRWIRLRVSRLNVSVERREERREKFL